MPAFCPSPPTVRRGPAVCSGVCTPVGFLGSDAAFGAGQGLYLPSPPRHTAWSVGGNAVVGCSRRCHLAGPCLVQQTLLLPAAAGRNLVDGFDVCRLPRVLPGQAIAPPMDMDPATDPAAVDWVTALLRAGTPWPDSAVSTTARTLCNSLRPSTLAGYIKHV